MSWKTLREALQPTNAADGLPEGYEFDPVPAAMLVRFRYGPGGDWIPLAVTPADIADPGAAQRAARRLIQQIRARHHDGK